MSVSSQQIITYLQDDNFIDGIPKTAAGLVRYTMAFASRRLAIGLKPSKKDPILITVKTNIGPIDKIYYVWTAFMVFGSRTPNLEFGNESIKIEIIGGDIFFDPAKELGFETLFSKNSLYETVFKHHLTADMFKVTKYARAFDCIPLELKLTFNEQKDFVYRKQTEAHKIETKKKKTPIEAPKVKVREQLIEELSNLSLFPEKPSARVKFAMALANFFLIGSKPPSEKTPIVLRSLNDPEFGKYLWTALMVFGKTHSCYSFDHKSIKIISYFSVEKELGGFWSTFSKNSLHETVFKNYLTKDMLVLTDNPEFFEGISRLKYKTVGEQIEAKKQKDIKEKEDIRKMEEFERDFQEEQRVKAQEKARMLEERRKNEELEVARKWEEIRKQDDARIQELAWQKELILRTEHAMRQEQALHLEQTLRQEEIRKQKEISELEEISRIQEAKRLEEIKRMKEREATFKNILNSTNSTASDLLELGLSYYEGKQIDRDFTKARLCFEKASELGSHIALYNLGYMDQYVEKNNLKAARNYQLAAYLGNDLAQSQLTTLLQSKTLTASELTALAKMYFQGDHEIIKDQALAIKLYNKACEGHDSSAALFLAQYYQVNEDGGTKDINSAFSYYILAVKYGNPEAFAALERLAEDLSPNHQLELSQLYGRFFHDNQRATYWRNKSVELSQTQFDIQFT